MKSQLTLTFSETLAYSSEKFVAHHGVREAVDTLVTLVSERRFALVYVHGEQYSGKTHLAVYCAGLLRSLGVPVDLVAAGGAAEWLLRENSGKNLERGTSLIVDDADKWIAQATAEGGFTAVADALSQAKGVLVLFSSIPAAEVKTPAQVKSRLAAGVQLAIGIPQETDLDPILRALCVQRGLKLTAPKRRFVLARIARTVPALTQYVARLCKEGQGTSASTAFEVLTAALD